MKERIKAIRNAVGKSQTDFAKELSVSRSAICKMESGENYPSEQTIKLICSEFNVNEEWLRTGNGEMFQPITKNDEISKLFGEVLKENNDDFKRRLISALAKLDDVGWEKLENLIDNISSKKWERAKGNTWTLGFLF